MRRPIRVEIVETNRYEFDLEEEDIEVIKDEVGFTAEAVRAFAIDLYENGGVDIQADGYEVSIGFDFDHDDIDEVAS